MASLAHPVPPDPQAGYNSKEYTNRLPTELKLEIIAFLPSKSDVISLSNVNMDWRNATAKERRGTLVTRLKEKGWDEEDQFIHPNSYFTQHVRQVQLLSCNTEVERRGTRLMRLLAAIPEGQLREFHSPWPYHSLDQLDLLFHRHQRLRSLSLSATTNLLDVLKGNLPTVTSLTIHALDNQSLVSNVGLILKCTNLEDLKFDGTHKITTLPWMKALPGYKKCLSHLSKLGGIPSPKKLKSLSFWKVRPPAVDTVFQLFDMTSLKSLTLDSCQANASEFLRQLAWQYRVTKPQLESFVFVGIPPKHPEAYVWYSNLMLFSASTCGLRKFYINSKKPLYINIGEASQHSSRSPL